MKLRIRSKLILLSIILISITFLLQTVFNRLFLDKYYQFKRKEQIKLISKDLILNNYTHEELQKIMSKNAITIDFMPVQTLSKVEENIVLKRVDGVLKGTYTQTIEELEENVFYSSEYLGVKFLTYYKKKENEGFYILKANMEEINQSIYITNNFILYSTYVAILFGIILSFLFANLFLKPIYKINKKLKKLSKFDFEDKLSLNSNDEFQELSENINFVSNELENKIQDLKIANLKLKEDIDREMVFKNKSKEFISSVTHEIKTPITIINTYAESLVEGYVEDNEKRILYSKTIMEEGENISKLVDDLLKIIKNEYDSNILILEDFDLLEIMKKELEKFKIDLEEKEVRYNINSSFKKIIVNADKEKIAHVLNNFISNAVSYVSKKGILNINVLSENEVYLIEIENSGLNIEEENLEEIWKPFFKVDKGRNRKYGGTGLGLSIVSETLKNHNQRFGVVNTDIGVKFWFELKKIN